MPVFPVFHYLPEHAQTHVHWVGDAIQPPHPLSSPLPLYAAKSLQSCPTLYDPIDGSPPGSPIPGILQARTLEWVAISFSNAWKWKVKVKSLSRVQTLSDPMDCSPPGSSVHGIFQAKVLEWGAIAFSAPPVYIFYFDSPQTHFLKSQAIFAKLKKMLVTQLCLTFCDPMDCSSRILEVGCHFLLQGVFLTQDQTWVTCMAGGLFTIWATREALNLKKVKAKKKKKGLQ